MKRLQIRENMGMPEMTKPMDEYGAKQEINTDPSTVPIGLLARVLDWLNCYCEFNEIRLSADEMDDLFEHVRAMNAVIIGARDRQNDEKKQIMAGEEED